MILITPADRSERCWFQCSTVRPLLVIEKSIPSDDSSSLSNTPAYFPALTTTCATVLPLSVIEKSRSTSEDSEGSSFPGHDERSASRLASILAKNLALASIVDTV